VGFEPGDFLPGVTENYVTQKMARATDWGYTIRYFMIYHQRNSETGKIESWSEADVELLRGWMDDHGYESVKLIYNARSFDSRGLATHEAIDGILNEGNTEYWAINKAGRHDLLRWADTAAAVKYKPFFFQITVHHNYDGNAYSEVRKMVRSISADILGDTTWIRKDNVVFLPMVYESFPASFPFLPEHIADGSQYGNSMSGLLLSLIEQRDKFEGRGGLISESECESFTRSVIANTGGEADPEPGKISIYPNPAASYVTLEGLEPGSRVEIIDVNGRSLDTRDCEDRECWISLDGYAEGMYILRFVKGNTSRTRKLIID
jgi:hypothetical protein